MEIFHSLRLDVLSGDWELEIMIRSTYQAVIIITRRMQERAQ